MVTVGLQWFVFIFDLVVGGWVVVVVVVVAMAVGLWVVVETRQ